LSVDALLAALFYLSLHDALPIYLPLLIFLPFKVLGARAANRRMNTFFEEHGIGWGLIGPGSELAGFVFTALDQGTKQFSVRLLGDRKSKRLNSSHGSISYAVFCL